MNTPLPERLRLGTRELHAQTERTGLMAELLSGRVNPDGYCALLRNLHALYDALETALRQCAAVPAVTAVNLPVLHRAPALASDLDALHGGDWRSALPLQDAAHVYVQRLQRLADGASPALVAHVYVRYLGDLHGGQVLKRLVARGLGLSDDVGLHFYDHGAVDAVLARRTTLRSALASLPVNAAQAEAIVHEACWAFAQHRLLFEQLHAAHPAPTLPPAPAATA